MSCRPNLLGDSTPRVRRPMFDRGDLVRLLANIPTERQTSVLASLGWAPAPDATSQAPSSTVRDVEPLGELDAVAMPLQSPVADPVDLRGSNDSPSEEWPQRRSPTRLWIVDQHEPIEALLTSSAPKSPPRLEWRNRPEQSPVHTPLATWSVLTPALRSALEALFESREIDVLRAVEVVAESRGDGRLPRRRFRHWGGAVQLIVDNSERLVPYFADQDLVVASLARLLGPDRLEVYYGDLSDERPLRRTRDGDSRLLPYEPPPFRSHVIVLGDLGALEPTPQSTGPSTRPSTRPSATNRWLEFGRRLADQRCFPVALVPCDLRRLSDNVRQTFRVRTWGPIRATDVDDDFRAQTIRKLLQLISFTVRVEPGLLRGCRRLLPEAIDPALESEVWQDRAFVRRTTLAGTLGPRTLVYQLVREFEQLPDELRAAALSVWRSWRQEVNCEVYFEELARLSDESRALLPPEDWDDATAGWRYLHQWVVATDPLDRSPVVNYVRRLLHRVTEQTLLDSDVGHLAIEMRRHMGGSASGEPQPPPPRRVTVFQTENQLILRGEDDDAPEPSQPTTWSRLASVRTQGGVVEIQGQFDCTHVDKSSGRVTVCLTGTESRHIEIPRGDRLTIRTDAETVRLRQVPRPEWADAAGHDRFGAWADVILVGVNTRWRWIPPGSFLMGSPESEPGRWESEGRQHWVTLTRGFWIADTPCTQAIWTAVMGKNPSRFVDPKRPVEWVSWDDVQKFLKKLSQKKPNQGAPGFPATLPTEAQWEYACRAGSTTALYRIAGQTGEIQILGERNAPALDSLAWFSGNSGGKTHPVGLKAPNAWGLYDMLGNVWEWCADGMRRYAEKWEVDPQGGVELRCIRGGGWFSHARNVRCASRHHIHAGHLDDNLGFRLVRVQP